MTKDEQILWRLSNAEREINEARTLIHLKKILEEKEGEIKMVKCYKCNWAHIQKRGAFYSEPAGKEIPIKYSLYCERFIDAFDIGHETDCDEYKERIIPPEPE